MMLQGFQALELLKKRMFLEVVQRHQTQVDGLCRHPIGSPPGRRVLALFNAVYTL